MARIIPSQLFTVPAGLNADYLEDYKNQPSFGGQALTAIGDGLRGVSDAWLGYETRQNAAEEKQYQRDKEAKAIEDAAKAKESRIADFDKTYGEADEEGRAFLDSPIGKMARKKWIDDGDGSMLQAYQIYVTEKATEASKAEAEREKAIAKAEKEAEKAENDAKEQNEAGIRQKFNEASIDGMTDPQVRKMGAGARKEKLDELKELYKAASGAGLDSLCSSINGQMRRLQSLTEAENNGNKRKGALSF